MRIAILGSRGFPSTYGGYETLVRHLARRWVADGHDITVYCRSRSESRRRWATEGVQCRWTPGIDSKSLSTLTFGATAHLDAMLDADQVVIEPLQVCTRFARHDAAFDRRQKRYLGYAANEL